MPTRGYRKGVSDRQAPHPHVLKTRTTTPTYAALTADCEARSMTLSALINRILEAHVSGGRVELPHPKGLTAEAIRELGRIGNNLNQLLPHAHRMRLRLIETETRTTLAAVLAAARRLG